MHGWTWSQLWRSAMILFTAISSDDHLQAPHVSNLSVSLQHDMIRDAVCAAMCPQSIGYTR